MTRPLAAGDAARYIRGTALECSPTDQPAILRLWTGRLTDHMAETMTVQEVLDQLRSTPLRLRQLTAGVLPEVLRTAPGPDAWSANDVLAHLRACSDRWGEAATRIVEEDSPKLRGTEPRVWITKTNYLDLEFTPSLRAFVRQRKALLAVLDPLQPADWQRTGTLVGAGKHVSRTVHIYAERLARHERSHVKQVSRTLATLAC